MTNIYIPNKTVYNTPALLNFVQTNEVYVRDEIFNTIPDIMLDTYNNNMDVLINPYNEDPPKVVRQYAFGGNVVEQEINDSHINETIYRTIPDNITDNDNNNLTNSSNCSSIIDKKIVINNNDLYCNESINNITEE
jgi:hypothetical protein